MNGAGFAVRGVVEGFYGPPWSAQQRLHLIEFLAERGMNTFVYAPKDDPLVRQDWRAPYAGEALARLAELVARCEQHGMQLVYCLSPGLSIRYSSDDDIELRCAKFASVAALGVSTFGLLLDDIPELLQHPADQAGFAGLVEAHQHLVSRVFDRLSPGTGLIVCPTQYWGYGDEDYIRRLGRGIDPRIELFWTGRAICSATIDISDAAVFARATGRLATYWDNYPVNDVAMGHELHIGPYRGRDRQLPRFATGVIANGMELFESSKIAFATIADFLADPEGYDPERSWQRALRAVVGEADVEDFALFADAVRSSCLCADDAPIVTRALDAFTFAQQYGDAAAGAAELAALATTMRDAAEHLLAGPVSNPALIDEVRPWLETFRLGAEALQRVAALASESRLQADGPSELTPYLLAFRDARRRVFGDVLEMTLAELCTFDPSPSTPPTAKEAS